LESIIWFSETSLFNIEIGCDSIIV